MVRFLSVRECCPRPSPPTTTSPWLSGQPRGPVCAPFVARHSCSAPSSSHATPAACTIWLPAPVVLPLPQCDLLRRLRQRSSCSAFLSARPGRAPSSVTLLQRLLQCAIPRCALSARPSRAPSSVTSCGVSFGVPPPHDLLRAPLCRTPSAAPLSEHAVCRADLRATRLLSSLLLRLRRLLTKGPPGLSHICSRWLSTIIFMYILCLSLIYFV